MDSLYAYGLASSSDDFLVLRTPSACGAKRLTSVSKKVMLLLATAVMALNMQASTALPWVYPGDIRDRFKMSDVVVAGVITSTSSADVESVDGTELDAPRSHLDVDRTFKGKVAADLSFT